MPASAMIGSARPIGSLLGLTQLSAETKWMAGGALAAAPEDVPAVVLPYGVDWLPAGSCQGFDAGPSGTVLVRGRSQHYLIVLASVSANRNLTHHDETGHDERAARSPGAPRPASIFMAGGARTNTLSMIVLVVPINLVVAWRIMLKTLLGRNQPDLPPSVLFSDLELKVLTAFAAQQGFEAPDTLTTAVRAVSRIGGISLPVQRPAIRHQGPLAGTCNPPGNVHRIHHGNAGQIMKAFAGRKVQHHFSGKGRGSPPLFLTLASH